MRAHRRKGAARFSTRLVLSAVLWGGACAAAQPAERRQAPDAAPSARGPDAEAQGDLSIKVRDVSGRPGDVLPLDIELVRGRTRSVETIRLLGLPQGVTVSDPANTFSSFSDNDDVDITAWDLSKLRIEQSEPRASSFLLGIAAISTPEAGGRIDVTSSQFAVAFTADAPKPAAAPRRAAAPQPARAPERAAPTPPADPAVSGTVVAEAPRARPADPPAPRAVAGAAPRTGGTAAGPPATTPPARPPGEADPLVERARELIRRGDISGARLLLERARARSAPNATFLLAQTWDPEMLRAWKVHGLRADPDLARSLYAQAAEQGQPDERLLAAARR